METDGKLVEKEGNKPSAVQPGAHANLKGVEQAEMMRASSAELSTSRKGHD